MSRIKSRVMNESLRFRFFAEIGEAHDAGDAAAGLWEHEHDDAGGGVVLPLGLAEWPGLLLLRHLVVDVHMVILVSFCGGGGDCFRAGFQGELFRTELPADVVGGEVEPKQLAVAEPGGIGIDDLQGDGHDGVFRIAADEQVEIGDALGHGGFRCSVGDVLWFFRDAFQEPECDVPRREFIDRGEVHARQLDGPGGCAIEEFEAAGRVVGGTEEEDAAGAGRG